MEIIRKNNRNYLKLSGAELCSVVFEDTDGFDSEEAYDELLENSIRFPEIFSWDDITEAIVVKYKRHFFMISWSKSGNSASGYRWDFYDDWTGKPTQDFFEFVEVEPRQKIVTEWVVK